MKDLITHLKDRVQGKVPAGESRSPKWPGVRDAHLKIQPNCAVCGGNKKLNVHHKIPFHIKPELELDPNNLVTLCEAWNFGMNCHLAVGHHGNFKNVNELVDQDIEYWRDRINRNPVK